ncbi:Aste57867_617 [Aphanomyces stellatus]|uniref:Aste57867_617 protein n=1 Tax=Aphanomyces stellatus TaxID=120398 RepID=A0A485K320_9STRA|nr:hypothetical protein As57867_000616 [Aphanomyces stellatus]VFT77842.1 Aste57867_617 [Aphanomyces stellatus]
MLVKVDRALPLDVLQRIALWLVDATTCFAFLEALGSPADRGSLESLWQLGLTIDRDSLWPDLYLDHLDHHTPQEHIRAVLPYYTQVYISGSYDIAWLRANLPSSMEIVWFNPPHLADMVQDSSLSDWYASWAMLPVVEVTLCHVSDDAMYLLDPVLPQMACLKSLHIHSHSPIDSILAFAASSSTLLELKLEAWLEIPGIDDGLVAYLMAWLQRLPVRTLCLSCFYWDAVTRDTKTDFCNAVLSHPTLSQLKLPDLDMSDLDKMPHPLPKLQTLALQTLQVPCVLQLFASPVVSLSLTGFDMPDASTVDLVFQALVRNHHLKSLTFKGTTLDERQWRHIVAYLPDIQLQALSWWYNCELTDEVVLLLADALKQNRSLRCCWFHTTIISTTAATTLLASVRSGVMKYIGFKLPLGTSRAQKNEIELFAATCGVRVRFE